MEELTNIITNIGFPMAITIYLLVRFEGMLKKVNESQDKLSHCMEKIFLVINSREGRLNDES